MSSTASMKQHVKVFFREQAELIGSEKGVGEVTVASLIAKLPEWGSSIDGRLAH